MTLKNLTNMAIPNQSNYDSSVDSGFSKLQVVQSRMYVDQNKLAYKDEFSALEEVNPQYTYSGDNLTRIDYDSGNYKTFEYDLNDILIRVSFTKGSVTYVKDFNYDLNGNTTSVDYSVV